VLSGIALVSCDRSEEKNEKSEKSAAASRTQAGKPLVLKEEEIREAGIKVEAAQLQTTDELVTLTATIIPNQERIAKVAPRLPGRVASVTVAQGARVKARETLAVLESSELGEARSAYMQAKSEAAVAEAALARVESLVREEIIPQKEHLRAKSDAERARAALRAAEDKLRLLGVSPSVAEKREAFAAYPLTAPFSGTIIERKAVVGELAQADQALFTVADLSTVWLEADVFEKDLAKLGVGLAARIAVTAYPDKSFTGKLVYLGDTMDKATRTVKARIAAPNPDGNLKPGMFATAVLQSNSTAQALLVPEQAVTLYQGHPAVFIEASGGFTPRAVETGPAVGGKVAIKAGLAPGERIVVAGAYALKARLLKSQFATED
jgi:cobalt-zinc-cadmium efflux system membrane fusion protein